MQNWKQWGYRLKITLLGELMRELKWQLMKLLVCLLVIDYRKIGVFMKFTGDGTFQEANAKVIVLATFRLWVLLGH